MTRSEELFEKSKQRIPGGVNSPVRAFQSVGGTPAFIKCLFVGTGNSRPCVPVSDRRGKEGVRQWSDIWGADGKRIRDR